jgi:hypothetical protein
MSALNTGTDIPAAIDTAEKAAFWLLLTLFDLNRGQTYKEAAGNSIDSGLAPLVDVSIVSTADGNQRAICRASFELDPNYTTDTTQKLWMFAQPLSDTVIPAAFKVD